MVLVLFQLLFLFFEKRIASTSVRCVEWRYICALMHHFALYLNHHKKTKHFQTIFEDLRYNPQLTHLQCNSPFRSSNLEGRRCPQWHGHIWNVRHRRREARSTCVSSSSSLLHTNHPNRPSCRFRNRMRNDHVRCPCTRMVLCSLAEETCRHSTR